MIRQWVTFLHILPYISGMWTIKWLNELLLVLCHSSLVEGYLGTTHEQSGQYDWFTDIHEPIPASIGVDDAVIYLLQHAHSLLDVSGGTVRFRLFFIFSVPLIPFNHAYCVRSCLMDHWLSMTSAPICVSWSLSVLVVTWEHLRGLSCLHYCSLYTHQILSTLTHATCNCCYSLFIQLIHPSWIIEIIPLEQKC